MHYIYLQLISVLIYYTFKKKSFSCFYIFLIVYIYVFFSSFFSHFLKNKPETLFVRRVALRALVGPV